MKTINTSTISSAILLSAALSAAAFAQTPAASAKADAPAPSAAPASGGKLSCDDLKQTIATKLSAHGVKQYALDVVEAGQAGDGKVVGQCDGGKSKVIYKKGASSTAAAK